MARNEFRDASFMVTACDGDVELVVDVRSEAPGLADAVHPRWSDFVTLADGREYGDWLVPIDGPLAIPRGESRELWLTFDARWSGLGAGSYDFRLELPTQRQQTVFIAQGTNIIGNKIVRIIRQINRSGRNRL